MYFKLICVFCFLSSMIHAEDMELPRTILKIDAAHHPDGLAHIHFDKGKVLYADGSWKHNEGKRLNDEEIAVVQKIGFVLKDNDRWAEEDPAAEDSSRQEISFEELKQKFQIQQIPSTIRAVHVAHHQLDQDHVHFTDGKVLNRDFTWQYDDAKSLSEDEKSFLKTIWEVE